MLSLLIIGVLVLFLLAFRFYGGLLERRWGIDPSRQTPAATLRDDRDYVPTPMPVVFGHHFASIAGAAPIIGPIAASVFGWLPVLLWIVIAAIFIGSVHDFGALFASIRHDAKPLSRVIDEHIGSKNRKFFDWFVWLTSILVIAAFTSIVADSFVSTPSAGTASVLFMGLAVAFGIVRRRLPLSLTTVTLVFLALMVGCIALGIRFPITLSKNNWMLLMIGYIAVASVTPVWVLLQPRDYLNSFLLFALIGAASIGLLLVHPSIEMAAFTGFRAANMTLFPLLFVTVACGAISGYHAMFASTTTSKQVNNERDARPIAMGGMLVEGLLAVIALLTAATLSRERFGDLYQNGGPIAIFSGGLSTAAQRLGISPVAAASFVVLAVSSFALTSLDSVARVARSIIQQIAEKNAVIAASGLQPVLRTPLGATLVTTGIGGVAAFARWQTVWPVFGCANQLIAALTLMTLYVWMKKSGRLASVFLLPMIFMFAVTSVGLAQLTLQSATLHQWLLAAVSLLLLALALAFVGSILRKGVLQKGGAEH